MQMGIGQGNYVSLSQTLSATYDERHADDPPAYRPGANVFESPRNKCEPPPLESLINHVENNREKLTNEAQILLRISTVPHNTIFSM